MKLIKKGKQRNFNDFLLQKDKMAELKGGGTGTDCPPVGIYCIICSTLGVCPTLHSCLVLSDPCSPMTA